MPSLHYLTVCNCCVAATVIGSDAKGTMNRAVSKLRVTYEKVVFPEQCGRSSVPLSTSSPPTSRCRLMLKFPL